MVVVIICNRSISNKWTNQEEEVWVHAVHCACPFAVAFQSLDWYASAREPPRLNNRPSGPFLRWNGPFWRFRREWWFFKRERKNTVKAAWRDGTNKYGDDEKWIRNADIWRLKLLACCRVTVRRNGMTVVSNVKISVKVVVALSESCWNFFRKIGVPRCPKRRYYVKT